MKSTVERTDIKEWLKILGTKLLVGVYILQDGKFCYVNPNFPLITGYSANELMDKDSLELVVPEDREMVRENAIKMLKGNLLSPYYFRVICKDGRIKWLMETVSSIQYRGRRATLGNYMEITERKQTEEALRESEERYKELTNSITDVFFAMDDQLRYIYWNKASEILTGIRAEDALGKSLLEIFPDTPGLRNAEKNYRKVLMTQQPQTFVIDFDIKDRHYMFEISAYPSQGGISVFIKDITQRKWTEQALQQSKEMYKALFESTVAGMVVLNAETMKIVLANQAAMKIFGFSSIEEAREVNPFDFILPEDRKAYLGITRNALFEQDSRKVYDLRAVTKDGREIWISTTAARIIHEGKLAGLVSFTDVTERKQADEALQQSEERYKALFESGVIGTIAIGAETMKIVLANQAAAKIFEFSSAEEGIGKNILDYVSPEEKERVLELIAKDLFEQDLRTTHEIQTITKNGRKIWISATGARIMHDGKLVGLISFTDITEHKQAEQEIRESEARFRDIFENANDGILVAELETKKFFTANKKMCRMLGYSLDEVRNLGVPDIHPEKDLPYVLGQFEKQSRGEITLSGDIPVKRRDGSVFYADVNAFALQFGRKTYMSGFFRDTSERKRAQEALQQSEENYRTLFDSSVIGTVVLDAETMKIAMANQAALKIFGFSSVEEVLEVEPFEFILPEDRKRYLEIAKKSLLEQNAHGSYDLRAVTRDGREIWINTKAARITHKGRLAGLISFADITEQKKQTEQLMLTNRLASVGELAAGAAHEINNPLTSVLGYAQLLMEKDIPDYVRKDLAFIKNEAQRAVNVTNNLLVFARKHMPKKQLYQINNIIEYVLKLRVFGLQSNNIEVVKHLDPNLPEILVDHFQMQQVFLNIVINAEYFMTEAHKKGTLTITTEKQNGSVRISFADDGPGIPPENLNRIFDPFFTTKDVGKGTGLGLSICHGIVVEHHGQIYAKSQLGKGTTIFIELPINSSDHIESIQ